MTALAAQQQQGTVPDHSRLIAAGLFLGEILEGAAYGFAAQTLTCRVVEKWRQAVVDLADDCKDPVLFLFHDFSAIAPFVPDYFSPGASQVKRFCRPQVVYSALLLPKLPTPTRQIFDLSDLSYQCHTLHIHTEVFHQPAAALRWLNTQIGAQRRSTSFD